METISPLAIETLEPSPESALPLLSDSSRHKSKQSIRTSLRASTFDGVFAAVFGSITGGVLLTNFLLQLGASPVEIGMLSSIPLLVNLLQPLGAYFADRVTSRRWYNVSIFGPSRLLWLVLVISIAWGSRTDINPHWLVSWTLAMVLGGNILGALGIASWFSWMVVLVPHRIRGRYFGVRNSAASLTTLISVPLFGFAVSAWPGGTIQGYGVVLFLAVLAGLGSLGCQLSQVDVNPLAESGGEIHRSDLDADSSLQPLPASATVNMLKDANFLTFLLYFGLWTFAVNLSSPFFNLYMLDNLALNLGWVTLYTSLASGANLVMLVLWGTLADRVGNRPLLLLVGILVAVTPLFWLEAGNDAWSLWVWLPLLHLLSGGTWAAIDLCNNNIQMEVAPREHPSTYFAIAAAVAGVSGALGTTVGGFLAQLNHVSGLPLLFALSAVVRLVALLPLVFVREPRSQPISQVMRGILPFKPQPVLVSRVGIADPADF